MGGQESGKKKWRDTLLTKPECKAIVFCVALDEFDKVSDKDEKRTYMDDATDLFAEIVNELGALLEPIAFFLFFNKTDLFKCKLLKFTRFYKGQYTGDKNDIPAAMQFLKSKFLEKVGTNIKVHVHETCAINQSQISSLFDTVTFTIVETRLRKSGLMLKNPKVEGKTTI
eukprot:TRINITY_DN2590_c0_g1_i4.p1 TRINITY_DN2590_c0_g1~~TRINITY_DN2590_c0_g1_i4.p1  ORF type:complete len:189 (+),score=28.15 TRINITY_DN2590_c0_g1_i4:59-568(+)